MSMSKYAQSFVSGMDQSVRLGIGENGAREFSRYLMTQTLQGAAVDMMAMVRGGDPDEIAKVIRRYCAEVQKIRNPRQRAEALADMICLCFYTRGCRGGKGERDLFYDMFLALFHEFPSLMGHRRLVELIPHFGCWRDLNKLLCRLTTKEGKAKNPRYRRLCAVLVAVQIDQLVKDDQTQTEITRLRAGELARDGHDSERIPALLKQMSLVGKWLPREKKSMDKSNSLAKVMAQAYALKVGISYTQSRKAYRKVCSRMTKFLKVTEVYMAAQDWDGISVKGIPTACMRINRKAFLNLQKDGRTERSTEPARRRLKARLQQLTQDTLDGKSGAKIHGTAQHPHQIVKLLYDHRGGETDETRLLEAQWKDMVRHYTQMSAEEGLDFTSSVCVVDVSGSMEMNGGQPMMVAIALGLLLSEIAANLGSPFGNRVITFSMNPRWEMFHEADSLLERIKKLKAQNDWGMNTDFEKVYRMIADHGRTHRLTPEEMPKMLWVLSDMQFDVARKSSTPWETHHQGLTRYFAQAGHAACGRPYSLNRMVYWNLRNTDGYPVDSNTKGALLVGGFSPDLMRAVLKAKGGEDPDVPDPPTPFDGFIAAVTEEFLNPVRRIIQDLSQNGEIELDFAGYHFVQPVEDAVDDGEGIAHGATDSENIFDFLATEPSVGSSFAQRQRLLRKQVQAATAAAAAEQQRRAATTAADEDDLFSQEPELAPRGWYGSDMGSDDAVEDGETDDDDDSGDESDSTHSSMPDLVESDSESNDADPIQNESKPVKIASILPDTSLSVPRNTWRFSPPSLQPLPVGWEERKNSNGRTYYVDHSNRRCTWNDPRLATENVVVETGEVGATPSAATPSATSSDSHRLASLFQEKKITEVEFFYLLNRLKKK